MAHLDALKHLVAGSLKIPLKAPLKGGRAHHDALNVTVSLNILLSKESTKSSTQGSQFKGAVQKSGTIRVI